MNSTREKKVKCYLSKSGEFVIDNYCFLRPFANFFPGIAGKYGIPMWVFYVNRGQAIISFGTEDKDHSILEFFPANKAWQLVNIYGFRTFIKLYTTKKNILYEPFQRGFINNNFEITSRMFITSYDLRLEEYNFTLGIKIDIEYFTIPNDSYAALVRIINIKNISKTPKRIELLDGLPQIVPFGTSNLFLKKLGRTVEAWMKVENLENGVPFYKLDVDPTDRPEVIHIEEGNFYLSFHTINEKPQIIKPIIDPEHIFGQILDLTYAHKFMGTEKFTPPKKELVQSKTPAGFTFLNFELSDTQGKTLYSIIGCMRNKDMLNSYTSKIIAPEYLDKKRVENKTL
ncbi:MAG: hypothetical protein NC908_05660, partial [Candidatus Omnitrophica bacterium]|nr:hypothetical protein [Candidatus Omnitrophota bacterium]